MDQPSQQTQGVKHFEAEIEKTWLRYSIFEIILAILMIAIGANYYGIVDGKEICPNNAALPYSYFQTSIDTFFESNDGPAISANPGS